MSAETVQQVPVVIRYAYPGTTGGRPVGDVYVTGPHFGADVWSHTYDPSEAATWPSVDAAWREIAGRSWPGAYPVPVSEAQRLSGVPAAEGTEV